MLLYLMNLKMSKENDYVMETTDSSDQLQLNEIYYNCTKCSSPIEILSINENECSIEFKCNNNDSHNLIIPINDYLEKMKNFTNKNSNNDICIINGHNKNKFECYCFDCNKHLCKECLKSRIHIGHNKINIIEIQPNQEELNIIENIIKSYEDKIDLLEKEKLKKAKEINEKLREYKIKLNEEKELKLKENKKEMEEELKTINDKYILDIDYIRNKYINGIK